MDLSVAPRRRWPRRLLVALVVALLAWSLGGGWWFARELTSVQEPLAWREAVVLDDLPGVACAHPDLRLDLVGLQLGDPATPSDTSGRWAAFGDDERPVSIGRTCAAREVVGAMDLTTPVTADAVARSPIGGQPPGTAALVDVNVWRDPRQAGLPARDVVVTTDLGPAPAWLVPGDDTWVVLVHGRGNTRAEGLRLARVVHELGHTALLVSYRDDGTGPSSDDGRALLGTRAWRDLDDAVTFVRARRPDRVVIAGWSQGGGIVASWLANSDQVDVVDGLVLDSPLLGIRATLRQQAANRGVPGPLVPPLLVGLGIWTTLLDGLDLDDVEHLAHLDEWPDVPVLLLHGDADTTVPVTTSDRAAARLGDRVTYVRPRGVAHVRAANVDPDRYRRVVTELLARVAG